MGYNATIITVKYMHQHCKHDHWRNQAVIIDGKESNAANNNECVLIFCQSFEPKGKMVENKLLQIKHFQPQLKEIVKKKSKSRKRERILERYIQKYEIEKIIHTRTPKLWFLCSTSCTVWKLFLLFFAVFEWNGKLKYHIMVWIFDSK